MFVVDRLSADVGDEFYYCLQCWMVMEMSGEGTREEWRGRSKERVKNGGDEVLRTRTSGGD